MKLVINSSSHDDYQLKLFEELDYIPFIYRGNEQELTFNIYKSFLNEIPTILFFCANNVQTKEEEQLVDKYQKFLKELKKIEPNNLPYEKVRQNKPRKAHCFICGWMSNVAKEVPERDNTYSNKNALRDLTR
jgi:hypothetical protein